MQGYTCFSVADLKNAFNLIQVKEGDKWKTDFRTPIGLYEYLVMPFGLTSALATFQAFIQDMLWDYFDVFYIIYLDNILIFSHSQEKHDQHVMKVINYPHAAHLYAKVDKCEFDKTEVTYLGYLLGADGIRMDPKKLNTIASWLESSSVKNIQCFICFTNFYHYFADNYAKLVLSLNVLICKKTLLSSSMPWKGLYCLTLSFNTLILHACAPLLLMLRTLQF